MSRRLAVAPKTSCLLGGQQQARQIVLNIVVERCRICAGQYRMHFYVEVAGVSVGGAGRLMAWQARAAGFSFMSSASCRTPSK